MSLNEFNYCKWCGRECQYNAVGGAFCPTQFKDWKDAAEFEARCMNNAIIYAYIKGVETRTLHEHMPDIIKDARLKAEEQMEP